MPTNSNLTNRARPKPSTAGGTGRRDAATSALVRLLALAGCAVAWSGCGLLQPQVDHTRFYVLSAPAAARPVAAKEASKGWNVGLRTLDLPAYLRNKAMVARTGGNEVQFADLAWWAETLDQGIARVLAETLDAAPNVGQVTLNSHGAEGLDYEVTIQVLACEGIRSETNRGSVRFSLAWELRPVGKASGVTKHGGFDAPPAAWNGSDFGQLAALLSDAIAAAGRRLAAELPAEPNLPELKAGPNTSP